MDHIKLYENFDEVPGNTENDTVLPESAVKKEMTRLIKDKISVLHRMQKVNRFKPTPFERRQINDLQKENTKIDRALESYIYHTAEVRAALKKVGITAQKSSSTAIRGYRNYSAGFSIDPDDKSTIDIKGYKDKIEELSKILTEMNIDNKVDGSYIRITPDKDLTDYKRKLLSAKSE